MRWILYAVLLGPLIVGGAGAQSEQPQNSIPPIKGQTVDASESNPESKGTQQNPAQSHPPVNVIINGSLQVDGIETKKGADTESSKWTDPITFFTFLLVVVGFLQFWVMRRQAKIMSGQAEILKSTDKTSKDAIRVSGEAAAAASKSADVAENTVKSMEATAERELRAYVFVTASNIQGSNQDGSLIAPARTIDSVNPIIVTLQIQNTGQTPAYDVKIYGNSQVVDWPLDATKLSALPFDSAEISKTSLGPGMHTYKYERLEPLGTNTFNAIAGGNKAVFIYGEIRYRDAFGRDRYTKYRFFTGGAPRIRGIPLNAHEDGNEAT